MNVTSEMAHMTLPQLLLKRAATTPDKVALRKKDYGIWNELTWGGLETNVRNAALGLLSLGVTPGDRVAVIADNIPEWTIMELAAQSLGAMTIGIYQSSGRDEVKYLLEYSEASLVLAEDQEQVDKVLNLRS